MPSTVSRVISKRFEEWLRTIPRGAALLADLDDLNWAYRVVTGRARADKPPDVATE